MERQDSKFGAERSRHLVFYERKDLFAHLDHLLCEGEQWIVVTGSPGIGKSAVLSNYLLRLETAGLTSRLDWVKSWLSLGTAERSPLGDLASRLVTVKDPAGRRVVPHHFLRYRYKDWAVPSAIEESLLRQVEALFPKLRDPHDRGPERLPNLLKRVASDALMPERRRLILVIDGLDEVEADRPTHPIFDFLPAQLPDGISVLCSSRPTYGDLTPLDWASPIQIDLDSAEWAESNDAVRQACIGEYAARTGGTGTDAEIVLQKANGNLRYLVELLTLLKENPRAEIERVPPTFMVYLVELWRWVTRYSDRRGEVVRAGLGVLANATAWTGQRELATRASWPEPEDPSLFLKTAMPLLLTGHSDDGPIYRLFHSSFGDFVSGQLNKHVGTAAKTMAVMFREMAGLNLLVSPPVAPPILETKPVSHRYALIIGIDDYVEKPLALPYCVNDAIAMHRTLTQAGYSAVVMHDACDAEDHRPTLFNIRAALAKLKGRLEPDELLLVFFAGHGLLVDGKPYLMARDSRSVDPAGTALPLSDVEAFMRASGSRRCVLVLDACHAGVDLGRDCGPSTCGIDPNFVHNAYDLAEGFAVLAGSTAAQRTQDYKAQRHGVFTYYLLKGLSGKADGGVAPKGFVTVDDLKNYVLSAVRTWCFENMADLQLPTARIEGIGDMIVAYTNPNARKPQ